MTARRDPRTLLHIIELAAKRIGSRIEGAEFAAFVADSGLQDRLERNFITISKPLNQFSRTTPELPDRFPEVGNITGFRHVLVHDYDRIEAATVWDFAVTELPPGLRVARLLLAELSRGADTGKPSPGTDIPL